VTPAFNDKAKVTAVLSVEKAILKKSNMATWCSAMLAKNGFVDFLLRVI